MQRFITSLLFTLICLAPTYALAGEPIDKTVEALFQEKVALQGKHVRLQGKVVKVNNGIMKRNFLHLQDGSGKPGNNDLTITSQGTATVGDEVIVTGIVSLDVDFGYNYKYPLLLEKATITKVVK